jgi:hypothetical protein
MHLMPFFVSLLIPEPDPGAAPNQGIFRLVSAFLAGIKRSTGLT